MLEQSGGNQSKCIKLYCECYANGMLCTGQCNCRNCLNNKNRTTESNLLASAEPGDPVSGAVTAEVLRVGQQSHQEGVHVQEVVLPEEVLRVLPEKAVVHGLVQVPVLSKPA